MRAVGIGVAILAGATWIGGPAAQPARAQGAIGFQPNVTSVPSGVGLNATPVVSADRRYVRLGMNPQFQAINGVDNFTFGAGAVGNGGTAFGFGANTVGFGTGVGPGWVASPGGLYLNSGYGFPGFANNPSYPTVYGNGGYGYGGYGGYYGAMPYGGYYSGPPIARQYNNTGGLMNSIQRSTGRRNSWRVPYW